MAAQGVLVFDEDSVATIQGGFEQTFVIVDDTRDVLVFDNPAAREIAESTTSTDFVIFDAEVTITETVLAPADFLLIDPPRDPARVVLDGPEYQDVLVITSGGPPGRTGEPGPPGPPGEAGLDGPGAYYQEFSFASPLTTWTLVHNQDSLGLNVETVDTNGEPVEGHVRFVDPNTIEVDWYYPTAGAARVFR